MRRLRVKTEYVRGDDGCYDLTISRQGYGIRLCDESGDYVDVTPDMWQRLVAAVETEDAPEPGERLYLRVERDRVREPLPWMRLDASVRDAWNRAAADLGIKPEGES